MFGDVSPPVVLVDVALAVVGVARALVMPVRQVPVVVGVRVAPVIGLALPFAVSAAAAREEVLRLLHEARIHRIPAAFQFVELMNLSLLLVHVEPANLPP